MQWKLPEACSQEYGLWGWAGAGSCNGELKWSLPGLDRLAGAACLEASQSLQPGTWTLGFGVVLPAANLG